MTLENNQPLPVSPLPPDSFAGPASGTLARTKPSHQSNNQSRDRSARTASSAAPATPRDVLEAFHPVIQTWFRRRFKSPTDAQAAGSNERDTKAV